MKCIKTGFQAYLEEYREYVHGDAFLTSGGVLLLRCCQRSRDVLGRRNFTVRKIAHWFDDTQTNEPWFNSTMIVEPRGYVDHGYDGVNEVELTAAESLR